MVRYPGSFSPSPRSRDRVTVDGCDRGLDLGWLSLYLVIPRRVPRHDPGRPPATEALARTDPGRWLLRPYGVHSLFIR